jgi:hypothetical protein
MQLVEEAVDGCWIGHHAWVKNSEDSVIGSVYCPPKGEQGLPIANRVETVINIVHRPEVRDLVPFVRLLFTYLSVY